MMKTSESSNACPKCGAPVPPEAPQGLCPKCVFAQAAASEAAPTATSQIPSLERLAMAFPQLQILELIGRGGMGFVFKARQPHLDRFVALKLLPDSLAHDPQFAERFNREGRTLARLNHPNIVSIFDFGQAGGFYFLLMEYVDGVNLRQAMQAGKFSPSEALSIVPKICEALQFAHEEGILHRDIKPENILLDAKGRVKIADFGIAKIVGEDKPDISLTATGAALGTPHYMAPEQFEKPATVDHRADIYSLGVVFYEMLTGELPIGRFSPPSQRTPVDPRVDDVVMRTLEKEREKRFQSAGEMGTNVEHLTEMGAGSLKAAPPKALGANAQRSPGGTIVIKPEKVLPDVPAWSLKAVWGAVLVGISLVPVIALLSFIAYFAASRRSFGGPVASGPGLLLSIASMFFSLPAIAGTILGWMGLSDVSRGEKRGAAFAIFAALFWPVILLAAFTVWLVVAPIRNFAEMAPWASLLLLLVPAGTVTFIIWAIYTAVHKATRQPTPQRRGALKWVFAALLVSGIGFVMVRHAARTNSPTRMQIDNTRRAIGPRQVTQAPVAVADSNTTPWIRFTFTAVELREVQGVRWLSIDYLDDVHGECQKSFPWETTIPDFKAETRTTEFVTDAKDSSPAVRHQRIEYRMPDSAPRDQLEGLRGLLAKDLIQKSFRLELGEEKRLFEFLPLTGNSVNSVINGSLKARIKVMPTLKSVAGKDDAVERRIKLARQQLDEVQRRVNVGTASQEELAEARRDVEVAEARGDLVMEARAKLKFAEYALQVALKRFKAGVISSQELRTVETQQAVAEIELQQALRKMPVKPAGLAPQKPEAAALQFRLVADGTDNDSPVDMMVQSREKGPTEPLRVLRTVLLDGSSVARAGLDSDTNGSRLIGVELTTEGARQFGAITAANINRQLAIIAGGKVLSAPAIRAAITGGELQISGDLPVTEMYGLVGTLNGNPTGLQFSPPVERSLPRARPTQTEAVGLDLDLGTYMTNRLFSTAQRAAINSFETNGVDLLAAGTNDQPASLAALGSVLIEVPAGAWDSMPAEEVRWNWKLMRAVAKEHSRFGVARGGSDTFMFRTHENGFGLVQFLPATNPAADVRIRYKLVESVSATLPELSQELTQAVTRVRFPAHKQLLVRTTIWNQGIAEPGPQLTVDNSSDAVTAEPVVLGSRLDGLFGAGPQPAEKPREFLVEMILHRGTQRSSGSAKAKILFTPLGFSFTDTSPWPMDLQVGSTTNIWLWQCWLALPPTNSIIQTTSPAMARIAARMATNSAAVPPKEHAKPRPLSEIIWGVEAELSVRDLPAKRDN